MMKRKDVAVQNPTGQRDGELSRIMVAYQGGLTADLLQAKIDGLWGPIWTIPSCSPMAMERAGRQFARCRAEGVRHYRRARLRRPLSATATDVVVMTELPSREQRVTSFAGATLRVNTFLQDEALATLVASFSPPLV